MAILTFYVSVIKEQRCDGKLFIVVYLENINFMSESVHFWG